MRRSTAAAVGTLTGAALIMGVRLTLLAPTATAAPTAATVLDTGSAAPASPTPSASPGRSSAPASRSTPSRAPQSAKPSATSRTTTASSTSGGLNDGVYRGSAAAYRYGTVQVTIKIGGGRITAADATYPTTGASANINRDAIPILNQEALHARKASDVDTVSGATLTSTAYRTSLQAALDAAA